MAPRPSSRTILYRPIRSIQFRSSDLREWGCGDRSHTVAACIEAPGKPDKLFVRLMSMSNGCLRRALSCALFSFVLCVYPGFGQPVRQPASKRQAKVAAPQFIPNRYIVFLQGTPVSARYTERGAMATAEATAYQRQIVSRQQSLMTELPEALGRAAG